MPKTELDLAVEEVQRARRAASLSEDERISDPLVFNAVVTQILLAEILIALRDLQVLA